MRIRPPFFIVVISCLLLLAACRAPTADPAPAVPTDIVLEQATATSPPTQTPAPTETPQPTAPPTPTLSPTPEPLTPAITVQNAAQVGLALALGGDIGELYDVAVSGDGMIIAAGGYGRVVTVFDGVSGEVLHTLERHRSMIYTLDMSPDGLRLASGGRDRTVQLWDPTAGERITGAGTTAEVRQLAFSADGSRFASVGYYSALGDVWDAQMAGTLFKLEGHGTRLRSVAWSADGSVIATGDEQGYVVLHDAATGQPVEQFRAVEGGQASELAFSPGGDVLAVGSSGNTVTLWDLGAGELITIWGPHTGGLTGLAYTPDGSVIITSGGDGSVRLWDVDLLAAGGGLNRLDARLASLGTHAGGCYGIDLSADGSTLVSAGGDGRVFVWRLGMGQPQG